MTGESVNQELEALLREHRRDRDGGDALARAVIRHARGLAPAEREELMRHLLDLVERETAQVWPIALEVLVRTGSPATARTLVSMFASGEHTAEWADALVLALLRLGNADAVARCRAYVQEELRLHHMGALPMLAWLYRESLDDALAMAARFFAGMLGATAPRDAEIVVELRRQLPRQLDGLLAVSTAAVLDLIDRVTQHDEAAGRILAALIAEQLAAPEARSRFGGRVVGALGEAIRLRAG